MIKDQNSIFPDLNEKLLLRQGTNILMHLLCNHIATRWFKVLL